MALCDDCKILEISSKEMGVINLRVGFCYHPVMSQAEEEIDMGNHKTTLSLGSIPPRLREGSLYHI
jgi:hypothetical protein